MQVYRFNKSVSQKAVWSKKKHDQQEFEKFKLKLGSLAPKTIEEFKDIMYNKPIEFNKLKEKFYIVKLYKTDFGYISPKKIIELDKLGLDAKRNNQISSHKKKGNFAILEYNNKVKFASSRISDITDKYYLKYKGDKSKLVLLKENRVFKTSELGDMVDGEVNTIPRKYDTEAKFFEFLVDEIKKENIIEINMISEKKMCESCRNVAKQFMKKYPNIKVNVVSGKTLDGWKGR